MFDNCKIGQGHSVALVEDSVGVDRRGIRRKACIVNISLAFFCSCFQHKSYSNPRDAAQAMCDIAIHSDVSVSRAAVWGQRQSVVLRWQWISGIWRPVISHLAEPTCGTIWFTYNLSPTAKHYAAWCCMALHGSGEGQVLNVKCPMAGDTSATSVSTRDVDAKVCYPEQQTQTKHDAAIDL